MAARRRNPSATLSCLNTSAAGLWCLLLDSHCLHVECTKTVVIGVIWSLGGCEKYVKHRNWSNTPTCTVCAAAFVIQCLLCVRVVICSAGNMPSIQEQMTLGCNCKEKRYEEAMINLLSLQRHEHELRMRISDVIHEMNFVLTGCLC